MITTPDGYKYADVTGIDISGSIVPALDGTASVSVERMEDICYLTEMARERMRWASPSSDIPVASYDPSCKVVEIGTLREICRAIRAFNYASIDHVGSVNKDMDISDLELPVIVKQEDGYAHDVLFANPAFAIELVSRQPLRPLVTDDLRRMYRDLDAAARFILANHESAHGETFASMLAWMSSPDGTKESWQNVHCEGPLVQGDGNSVVFEQGGGRTNIPGYIGSYYLRTWNDSGAATYTSYTEHQSCVVINKGLCFDDAGSRILPERMTAIVGVGIEYTAKTSEGVYQMKLATGEFPIYVDYAGSAAGTVFAGRADAIYNLELDMAPIFELARRWLSEHDADFGASPSSLSVQFNGLISIDTGVIDFNSSIPDTWTWSPS